MKDIFRELESDNVTVESANSINENIDPNYTFLTGYASDTLQGLLSMIKGRIEYTYKDQQITLVPYQREKGYWKYEYDIKFISTLDLLVSKTSDLDI